MSAVTNWFRITLLKMKGQTAGDCNSKTGCLKWFVVEPVAELAYRLRNYICRPLSGPLVRPVSHATYTNTVDWSHGWWVGHHVSGVGDPPSVEFDGNAGGSPSVESDGTRVGYKVKTPMGGCEGP